MLFLRLPAVLLSALASLLIAGAAVAADLPALVGSLTTGSFGDRETAVGALATSGDARAAPILEALAAGIESLYRAPDLRTELAAAGSERVEQFDAPRVAAMFLDEVTRLL